MFPAVKDGDLIIGYRLQDTYLEDDAIVYEADGELRVGRIIGRQSDVISMDDSGTLIVNGTVQGGEICFLPMQKKELSTLIRFRKAVCLFWGTTGHRPKTAGISAVSHWRM